MAALESVNAAGLVREHLESASPDLLRAMMKTYGERSEDWVNQRNGYRSREWDTREPARSNWRCRSCASMVAWRQEKVESDGAGPVEVSRTGTQTPLELGG